MLKTSFVFSLASLSSAFKLHTLPGHVASSITGCSFLANRCFYGSFRKQFSIRCSAGEKSEAFYWQGGSTLKVSKKMHIENRARVLSHMKDALDGSIIFMAGGVQEFRADSDHEILFRQESNFHFLFGVNIPDCLATIDVPSGFTTLYVPRLPESYKVWMGEIPPNEQLAHDYMVDEVRFVDEISSVVVSKRPSAVYVYGGVNSDSGRAGRAGSFPGLEGLRADTGLLHYALYEARVIKSPREVEIIRYANQVSSEGHVAVMRAARAGLMEYDLEAVFRHAVYRRGGMRRLAYTAICGSGPRAAILHYGHAGAPNDRPLAAGDLVLCDLGGEYYSYASDITHTFPVSGRFSPLQRQVYEGVLGAKRAVEAAMRPGVSWVEMHLLAERTLGQALADMGVLRPLGRPMQELVEAGVVALFMPHGLGHLLGLDTHDVGGYPSGAERATRLGLRSLRNVRRLAAGMVLTVEPGCYFIPSLLRPALADPALAPHLNGPLLEQLFALGGVRLEDNVLIIPDGCQVLTTVPRDVAEVEALVGSG